MQCTSTDTGIIRRVAARYYSRDRYLHRILTAWDPSPAVVYVAVFLTPMARRKLLKRFGQKHPNLFADHMTIWNFQDGGDPESWPFGKTAALKVIGYVSDDKGQAVIVRPPTKLRPVGGRTPHITISTTQAIPPSYSNELIRKSWDQEEARRGLPTVKGKVGWWDGKKIRLEPPVDE